MCEAQGVANGPRERGAERNPGKDSKRRTESPAAQRGEDDMNPIQTAPPLRIPGCVPSADPAVPLENSSAEGVFPGSQ